MPFPFRIAAAAAAALAACAAAAQQAEPSHDGHSMHPTDAGPDMRHDAMPRPDTMRSAFGPYAMTREGSGTSWQPDATPMGGVHATRGDWSLMAHGFVNAIHDRQSGPRGDSKTFAESMLMLMAQRPAGAGTFGVRAMLSLDPTMGRSGYPLLFQTGETADGRTPLVDRQHPHDAFMELAATYSVPFGGDGAAFVYLGLPGEPALGPPAFMHRFSGMRNPEAPLTHHWLDSTHITFGVASLGVSKGPWKLEASSFNGREPDQYRWNIETRRFDSWSARLSWNPTPAWALQVSYGDLKRPEQLEPDTRILRTTASASYHARLGAGQWQSTLAWGRNDKRGPEGAKKLPGWLLESTLVLRDTYTVFGRAEQVDNDELFREGEPLHGRTFRVRKLSVGYIHDFARTGPVKWGLGGLIGVHDAPAMLETAYGRRPISAMVFLQGWL